MRVYRTECEGVSILRLSGEVRSEEARMLLDFIEETTSSRQEGYILDFQGVEHVNYHVFELFEEWFSVHPDVLISGLSDYILDILAFVRKGDTIPVFSDWRTAFRCLKAGSRRLSPSGARELVASC
ncbi:MAG: hypothetical protein JW814_11505 [Candidatus Krumholzibacteriota bacterium]|nr:hypothetical protein [Candidatus Krumholzibacteriota bacterium]